MYNVVLVSGGHQGDSVSYILYILICIYNIIFHYDYYGILNVVVTHFLLETNWKQPFYQGLEHIYSTSQYPAVIF